MQTDREKDRKNRHTAGQKKNLKQERGDVKGRKTGRQTERQSDTDLETQIV